MSAQVGFNFGGVTLSTFTLPGSRMENITDIDNLSSINNQGQFVFRIDDSVPRTGCSNDVGMYVNNVFVNGICTIP